MGHRPAPFLVTALLSAAVVTAVVAASGRPIAATPDLPSTTVRDKGPTPTPSPPIFPPGTYTRKLTDPDTDAGRRDCPSRLSFNRVTRNNATGISTVTASDAAVDGTPCNGTATWSAGTGAALAASLANVAGGLLGRAGPRVSVDGRLGATARDTDGAADDPSAPTAGSIFIGGVSGAGTWCGYAASELVGTAFVLSAAAVARPPFSNVGFGAGDRALELVAYNRTRCLYAAPAAAVFTVGLATATPTPTPTATPTPAAASTSDEGCFPAYATAELASGATVRMDALAVGDVVRVSPSAFSPVIGWSHAHAAAHTAYVRVETTSAALDVTPGHYLYVYGRADEWGRPSTGADARRRRRLVAAGVVAVGDRLQVRGALQAVTAVTALVAPSGRYAPHTAAGSIVVDGVTASCYTTAVAPAVAHALLAPVRVAAAAGLRNVLGGRLAGGMPGGRGGDVLRRLLPTGSLVN